MYALLLNKHGNCSPPNGKTNQTKWRSNNQINRQINDIDDNVFSFCRMPLALCYFCVKGKSRSIFLLRCCYFRPSLPLSYSHSPTRLVAFSCIFFSFCLFALPSVDDLLAYAFNSLIFQRLNFFSFFSFFLICSNVIVSSHICHVPFDALKRKNIMYFCTKKLHTQQRALKESIKSREANEANWQHKLVVFQ